MSTGVHAGTVAVGSATVRTDAVRRPYAQSPMDATARLHALLNADPPQFPLDEAALLIAAHERPALDIASHLALLDQLADDVPKATFPALVAAPVRAGRLHRQRRRLLRPGELDARLACSHRRIGIPILLAVLAIEVGRRRRRAGARVRDARSFPDPLGVDPDLFADPFHGPRLLDHDGVPGAVPPAWPRIPPTGTRRTSAPTSRRDIVVRILNNLKRIHRQRNDYLRLGRVMRMRSSVPGLGERPSRRSSAG